AREPATDKHSEPAHGTASEDDRAIEDHEQKEAVQRDGGARRTPREVCGSEPPPKHVGHPREGEEVVEKGAAAPMNAGDLARLPRGFSIRGSMAPVVVIGK